MLNFGQIMGVMRDLVAGKPPKARSPKWPALRKAFIDKNPFCAACGAKDKLEVHHVVPYHVDPSLELVESNLLTLCDGKNACHRTWGHFYNWRLVNPAVVEDCKSWRDRVVRCSLDYLYGRSA